LLQGGMGLLLLLLYPLLLLLCLQRLHRLNGRGGS